MESPRTSSHSEKWVVDSMSEWVYVVWQEVTGLWHKTSPGASYSSSAGSYDILGTYLCYLSLGVLISKIEILMLPSYSIIMKVKYIRNNRFQGLIFSSLWYQRWIGSWVITEFYNFRWCLLNSGYIVDCIAHPAWYWEIELHEKQSMPSRNWELPGVKDSKTQVKWWIKWLNTKVHR